MQPQNHSQISSRTTPGVARRGVPPTRHARVCRVPGVTRRRGGVCTASSPDLLGGSRAQHWLGCSQLRGPQRTVGRHRWRSPELVTHPSCISPSEVSGVSLLPRAEPDSHPPPQLPREAHWRLGTRLGAGHVVVSALPSKMPVLRRGARLSMNLMVSANSIGGACLMGGEL